MVLHSQSMRTDGGFQVRLARLLQRRIQRGLAQEVGITPYVLSVFELGYRTLHAEIVSRIHESLRNKANAASSVEEQL